MSDVASEPWAVPLSAVSDTGVVLGGGALGAVSVFLWHRTRVVARSIGHMGPKARHSALIKEVGPRTFGEWAGGRAGGGGAGMREQ